MIALIQRVTEATVTKDKELVSSIGKGFLILFGVFEDDTEKDVEKLAQKTANLRIFADHDNRDKMNVSVLDEKAEILVVSQFTLCADLTMGRRPSFIKAKNPEEAKRLYELFVSTLTGMGIPVKKGSFGEYMHVSLVNDGPVTIIMDSKKI